MTDNLNGDAPPGRQPDRPPGIPSALANIGDAVVVLDRTGTITYANPYALHLLGYSAATQMVGRSIAEFLHPEELMRAIEVIPAMASQEPTTRVDPAVYRIRTAGGEWRELELNGTRFDPGTGGPGTSLLVWGRHSGDYVMQNRTLAQLSSGAPFDQILQAIVGVEGRGYASPARQRYEELAVVVPDVAGPGWLAVGSPVITGLVGSRDSDMALGGIPAPGRDAVGTPVPVATSQLPEPARSVGLARGLVRWWAVAVPDQLTGRQAMLVGWTDDQRRPVFIGYTLDAMTRMLGLVLQWRSHVTALERAARDDALTGLLNRRGFFERLDVARRQRSDHGLLGVVYVDLDHFKDINDSRGHAAGDSVLVAVAERLRAAVRPIDAVARLGGDEFAVLCPDLADETAARAVAERVLAAVCRPIEIDGEPVPVAASVGLATAAAGTPAARDLLERSDRAMYRAKASGRGALHTG